MKKEDDFQKTELKPVELIWERVQVGARMEKRMVKVLKGLAEYLDISMGDLLEGIVLHAFEGKIPFQKVVIERINQMKDVYGMDYGVEDSHRHPETGLLNLE